MLGSPFDQIDPTPDDALPLGIAEPQPAPGLLEATGAVFDRNRAGADWGWNQARYENDARDEIATALEARGRQVRRIGVTEAIGYQRRVDRGETLLPHQTDHLAAFKGMLSELTAERGRDPTFLPDYADVHDLPSLEAHIVGKRNRDVAAADAVIARAGTGTRVAAEITGGVGAGLLDPTSYIPVGSGATVGVSIARQIANTAFREGLANMALTGVTEPLVRSDAARIGQERDLTDTVVDIGLAGITGSVIGAAGKTAELSPDLLAGARESVLTRHFDKLPERTQQWMLDRGTIDQRVAVDGMRDALGDRMTPDERAAAHVLETDAEIREANPFRPSPAADMVHGQRLSAALDRLLTAQAPPDFAPVARPIRRSETALSSNAAIAARMMMAESGGNPRAKNQQSSAAGLGQFIDQTWLGTMKKHGRAEGYGELATAIEHDGNKWIVRDKAVLDRIIGLKMNGDLAKRMTERVVGDYRAILERQGMPVTADNAYLIHFLGPKRAMALMHAPRGMEVKAFLPEAVIAANEKVLRGKSVGEVREWAARQMGEDPGAVTDRTSAVSDEIELRDDLTADVDDMRSAKSELYGDPTARPDMIDARVADAAPIVEASGRPRRAPVDRGPVDLLTQIARWGGLRNDEGHDLGRTGGLDGRFTRGGRVLTKGGMSVDALGERLWEAGWFGPPSVSERPTEADVIDLIDTAVAKGRLYHPDERAEIEARSREIDDGREEITALLEDAARTQGVDPEPALIESAIERMRVGDDADAALMTAINDRFADASAEDGATIERSGVADDAASFMSPTDWTRVEEQRDRFAAFDDPYGDGALLQADSLEHDLIMAVADDDGRYRMDADGEETSFEAVIAAAEGDMAAIEAARRCMMPPGKDSE